MSTAGRLDAYRYTNGEGSPLALSRTGDIHCADAITWYVIERRANWNTGISHRLTTQDIADAAGIHPRTPQRSIVGERVPAMVLACV